MVVSLAWTAQSVNYNAGVLFVSQAQSTLVDKGGVGLLGTHILVENPLFSCGLKAESFHFQCEFRQLPAHSSNLEYFTN